MGGVLPLCREAVSVFYSCSWLGKHQHYCCYSLYITSYVWVHRCTSFTSSSFAHLINMVSEMGGKWPYSHCFVESCLKQYATSLCGSHLVLFQGISWKWCSHIADIATAWKNSHFILSERLDFHMVINPSIAVHALYICILVSL